MNSGVVMVFVCILFHKKSNVSVIISVRVDCGDVEVWLKLSIYDIYFALRFSEMSFGLSFMQGKTVPGRYLPSINNMYLVSHNKDDEKTHLPANRN